MNKIQQIINNFGGQTKFSREFDIPLRTVQDWASGRSNPPEYLPKLIEEAMESRNTGIYEFGEYIKKRICTGSEHFYLFFTKDERAISKGIVKLIEYSSDKEHLQKLIDDYGKNVQNVKISEYDKDGKIIYRADFEYHI